MPSAAFSVSKLLIGERNPEASSSASRSMPASRALPLVIFPSAASRGPCAANGGRGPPLESERRQLAQDLLVQPHRVEPDRPADLRPVVRLHLAQHLSPRLRRSRDQAVVGPAGPREMNVRGPEQWVGVDQV